MNLNAISTVLNARKMIPIVYAPMKMIGNNLVIVDRNIIKDNTLALLATDRGWTLSHTLVLDG